MPEQNSPAEAVWDGVSRTTVTTINTDSTEQNQDARNVLICLAVFTAEVLLAWPFADLAFGDDVAYSHVAYILTRTGHLIFNGWEAAMMLQQAYWGALFIRLFGFSFVCMRLSTIPLALGAVVLCYKLARRAGLRPQNALFVTLLFALCPLYLPLAVSFMTDVPAIFFMFASFYAFARAEESVGEPGSYGWLALGAVTGFIGGTGRQIVWLVPVIVLPYLAWVKREHRWFRLWAEAAWVGVLAGLNYTTFWFNHQLYTVFQPSVLSELKLAIKHPFATVNITARLYMMLVLLVLPAAIPLLLQSSVETWRGPRLRKIIVATLLLVVLAAIAIHPSLASLPWVSNTLDWEGIHGDGPLPGRPIVLTRPIRAVLAVAVYVAVCILAGELNKIGELAKRAWPVVRDAKEGTFTLAAMSLVSAAYFFLVIVRASEFTVFDRYLLPLLPCAATLLLLPSQAKSLSGQRMLRRAMRASWTLLIVFGAYAILSTQDYWSLARARVEATRRLESAKIPRSGVDAGMEYNGWTQLLINGRLNWWYVKNPPGAYRPGYGITPDVVPLYRLEYAPNPPETVPSEFGSVPYFSLLPPFHKQVSIDRVVVASKGDR
jgi:hypothetical protein